VESNDDKAVPPRLPDSVATEQRRQSEHDLADFFEHAPIGLHWAGPDGLILRVNQAELDLTGYPREEYLGRPSAQFHKNPDLMRAALGRLAHGETVPAFESQLVCKNGSAVDVLISLDALRRNGALVHARCLTSDITLSKREEAHSAAQNLQLRNAARLAGMEEVASNVLHNVGNVLNSVNVSATTAIERISHSQLSGLASVAELVRAHADNLADFVTTDPRGLKLPHYLETLARYWTDEQALLLRELRRLTVSINHIKDIVSRQQSLTGPFGQAESVSVSALIDDSLAVAIAGPDRLAIDIRRDYTIDFSIHVDRRKCMLILVNLLANARDAVTGIESRNKQIIVRTELLQEGFLRVEVQDNGAGIAAEDLGHVFDRGFTTKKAGHGFGLHSSALAARELGGSIEVHSEGPGCGARFAVNIPLSPGIKKDGTERA
jgi:two-component system, LuxR family, sensor kinase FixL